jgi:hypothetical protein
MVKEAQQLTGKLGHLAKSANWVFCSPTYTRPRPLHMPFQRIVNSWQTPLWSFNPPLSCYGLATFSATSRTKSATYLLPSRGLQKLVHQL